MSKSQAQSVINFRSKLVSFNCDTCLKQAPKHIEHHRLAERSNRPSVTRRLVKGYLDALVAEHLPELDIIRPVCVLPPVSSAVISRLNSSFQQKQDKLSQFIRSQRYSFTEVVCLKRVLATNEDFCFAVGQDAGGRPWFGAGL